jgi:hypothetical protein
VQFRTPLDKRNLGVRYDDSSDGRVRWQIGN